MIDNELIEKETCETCGCGIDESESNYGEGICDDCYETEHEHDGQVECLDCQTWIDENETNDYGMCEECCSRQEEIDEAIETIKNGMETLESYGFDTLAECQKILKELREK